MEALDGVLALFAVVSIFRVEHLIASDFWIAFCGSPWKRRVVRMSIANKSDVTRMWRAYQETGGGKYPFLFFGIKSYRLLNWSRLADRRGWAWRSRALRLVRFCWRFYTFVPAMSCLVIVFSVVPGRLPMISRVALMTVAFAMVIGMLAIAAEVMLAALVLGSWAVLYHRWPHPGNENSRLREFSLGIGCVLLTLLAVFALVLCAETRVHAYAGQSGGVGWLDVRNAITTSYSGFVSDAISRSEGPVAFFINLLTGLNFISYFVFLFQAAARLWGN